jgi:hypothetical protein
MSERPRRLKVNARQRADRAQDRFHLFLASDGDWYCSRCGKQLSEHAVGEWLECYDYLWRERVRLLVEADTDGKVAAIVDEIWGK